MRLWCADIYDHSPLIPEDMITLRTPADDHSEQRIGFWIVDDSKRGIGLGKTLVNIAVDYTFAELGAAKVSLGVI